MGWIEKYKVEKGKLPPIPDWLKPIVEHQEETQVHPDLKLITPSGQFFNNLTPKRQQEWRELVEWLGQDAEEYLGRMRQSLPKLPLQLAGRGNKKIK